MLDVRDDSEWDEGHISGALHAYVGDLEEHLPAVDRQQKLIVCCSVGHRAAIAVSILRAAGFSNVYNMLGGMKAWQSLQLPIESHHGEQRPVAA
ncbi:MAG TPA: rhodanese-like domain-containing protein [Steroidobacteraceae bacterium]|nr:rhodanese-like domain-containing protein [Steroidobacteraceae bacterium]